MLQIKNINEQKMGKDQYQFLEAVLIYINTNNIEVMNEAINTFSEFCFNNEPFNFDESIVTDYFIENIIQIIKSNECLSIKKRFHFFTFFLNDWSRFTYQQKKKLIDTFEEIIPILLDTTSVMILIEVIAKYEANKNSFKILNKLRSEKKNKDRWKYLVAYGYRLLIENINDITIKKDAFSILNSMVKDTLENVRVEAMNAVNVIYQKKDLISIIK